MEGDSGSMPPSSGLYVDTLRWCQGSRLGYPLCLGETGVFKQPTALKVCARSIAHAALDSPLS